MSKQINNQSKLHRKYHRVSTFTPDQQAFINYLMQRGYDLTLKAFQQQIQANLISSSQWFFNKVKNKEGVSYSQLKAWIQRLKKVSLKKGNQFVKIQFLVLVLYCSHKSVKISGENGKMLKKFIQNNGMKLSQFPQLLPYFALPYIQQPSNHPFLRKIYTQQWKQQLMKLIVQNSRNQKQKQKNGGLATGQNQWYSVVKDLIKICLYFDSQCQLKTSKYKQMLQKVHKYQKVIQQNDSQIQVQISIQNQSVKPSQLSGLIYVSHNNNQLKNLEQQKSVGSQKSKQFEQISFPKLKQQIKSKCKQKQKNAKQICMIFHALKNRITETRSGQHKKQIIEKYIMYDILFLKEVQSGPLLSIYQQIQCLKLVNAMSSSSKTVQYLAVSQRYIQVINRIICDAAEFYVEERNQLDQMNSANLQRLLQAFSIMQKISFNKQVITKTIKDKLPETLILGFLSRYQQISITILTYVLAIVLNIILQPEGKTICSFINTQRSLTFFELMLKIWKYWQILQTKQKNQSGIIQGNNELQSIIYSIFYVLLSLDHNKKIAKSQKFQKLLTNFLQENKDEYHEKVVQYMIQILNSKQEDKQDDIIDGNDNEQDSFDDNYNDLNESKDYVWIGQTLAILQQQNQCQKILAAFYLCSLDGEKSQNLPYKQKYKQKIVSNVSAPLAKIKQNEQKQREVNNKQETGLNRQSKQNKAKQTNNSEVFAKVEGYDPNKYKSWKRLKTKA